MRIENIIASLKRLFEQPSRPAADGAAASSAEPAAERPPPPEAAPPEVAPPENSVVPVALPAADDIAEVRALLEAVTESEPAVAEAEPTIAEAEPAVAEAESTPALPSTPTQSPPPVSDALVLALATPAKTFSVRKAGATLGRGEENTFRLDDLSVSRRHARITYRQGGYWLSDLGSMGGTWVDGARLSAPQRVAAGQVIDIGLCRLSVTAAGGASSEDDEKKNDGTKKSASKPRADAAAQVRRRR